MIIVTRASAECAKHNTRAVPRQYAEHSGNPTSTSTPLARGFTPHGPLQSVPPAEPDNPVIVLPCDISSQVIFFVDITIQPLCQFRGTREEN